MAPRRTRAGLPSLFTQPHSLPSNSSLLQLARMALINCDFFFFFFKHKSSGHMFLVRVWPRLRTHEKLFHPERGTQCLSLATAAFGGIFSGTPELSLRRSPNLSKKVAQRLGSKVLCGRNFLSQKPDPRMRVASLGLFGVNSDLSHGEAMTYSFQWAGDRKSLSCHSLTRLESITMA